MILLLISNYVISYGQEICKDSLECYVSEIYPEVELSIKLDYRSEASTTNYQTGLLIDIDDDCQSELIIAGTTGFQSDPRLTSGIHIINSADGSTIRSLPTVYYAWTAPSAFALADVDRDGKIELIIAAADHGLNPASLRGRLVCYDLFGTTKWVSNEKFGANSSFKYGGSPSLADFNHDGIAEVYIYNEIFNAVTGVKLVHGGNNGLGLGSNNFDLGSISLTIAAQLDDNEMDLELAAGYTVYKVNITNSNGTSGNTMIPLNFQLEGQYRDGVTTIGDINNDGRLDIVVSSRGNAATGRLYAYTLNGNAPQLIGKATPPTTVGASTDNMGAAFIGDIDGNGQVSIGITRPDRLLMYDYNGSINFTLRWQLNTNDGSGLTGVTMFDFDQNGVQELVYRDETHIRIMKGSETPPVDIAKFNCISGTGMEYPIVGELEGTRESRICIACGEGGSRTIGKLNIFSSAIEHQPWAPSRAIWNQYGYHVFNINNDLTVPIFPFNNATYADGTFNNYFVQASYVNEKGEFIQPAFDLSGEINCLSYNEVTGDLEITFDLFNNSTSSLYAPPGFTISFFHGDPATTGVLIGTYTTSSGMDPGETLEDLFLTLGITDINFPNGIYMLVNSSGILNFDDIYNPENYNLLECNFEDNIVQYPDMSNITSEEFTLCDGETYDFFGTILTESGLYYHSLTNQNGCDSILTFLQLNVSQNTSEEINVETCNSYLFNNENLTQSGVYFLETTNQFGCDSLVTLNLEVFFPESIFLEENACSEFYWDLTGLIYNESGLYDHILANENGCDTLVQLKLTVNEVEEFFINHDMCLGEEFSFDGIILTESGTYNSQITSSNGCDSIITTLYLNVHNEYYEVTEILSCEPIAWNGDIINESGEYLFEGTSEYGCDSTVVLKLEIQEHQFIEEFQSDCDEYYWPVTDQTYTESGIYSFEVQDENGCDSIFNLELMIHLGSFHSEFVETDQDYFWRVNDSLITQSGEYVKKFTNQFGCDSIHVLKIVIEKFRSIWLPNVFSPNFDGINDEVFVHASDGVEEILKFSIFNRWGALIFELENFPPNDPNFGWTGIFKDQEVNQAVFVYVVHWIGNSGTIEVVSGDITLLRY